MQTILIAVSGMSPAILTETVWALARETPPVVPDQVVVITTSNGEEDIRKMLLTPRADWEGDQVWARLRRDIFAGTGLPNDSSALQLGLAVIDLPDAATGIRRSAYDLRTPGDNEEAADFIVRQVDSYANKDTRIIASIAGGRKTMGALLYAAMSLRGTEDDRITHVLVNGPFEFLRDFFYPDQPVQQLKTKPQEPDSEIVMAATATIELADIPFVPLRNRFEELREPRRTFSGIVDAYSRSPRKNPASPPRVSLDIQKQILLVEGRGVGLKGRQIAIVAFLMDRAQRRLPFLGRHKDAVDPLLQFLVPWKSAHLALPDVAAITDKLDAGDIARALSDLRIALDAIGLRDTIPFLCPSSGRFGFEIAPDAG